MHAKKIISLSACVILCAWLVVVASNPLRRSEHSVSQWLQKQTPLGSSVDDVRVYAEKKGWFATWAQGSDGRTRGKFIRGELGSYRTIVFATFVTVFWEFDSQSKLERIRIWKTVDGI